MIKQRIKAQYKRRYCSGQTKQNTMRCYAGRLSRSAANSEALVLQAANGKRHNRIKFAATSYCCDSGISSEWTREMLSIEVKFCLLKAAAFLWEKLLKNLPFGAA